MSTTNPESSQGGPGRESAFGNDTKMEATKMEVLKLFRQPVMCCMFGRGIEYRKPSVW